MEKHTLIIEYWANKPLFPSDHIEIEQGKYTSSFLRYFKQYLCSAKKLGYRISDIIP